MNLRSLIVPVVAASVLLLTTAFSGLAAGVRRYSAAAERGWTSPAPDRQPDLTQADEVDLDMDEYLYGHVRDSYEWHITTINGKPVSIPLPVIVISKIGNGAHIFSSHHLEEGEYKGFSIATSGKYANKIVEKGPDGAQIRPWDFSITKNVIAIRDRRQPSILGKESLYL